MVFDFCPKGHTTVKCYGEGYSKKLGRHDRIVVAWFCKKCKILFLNPDLDFEEVKLLNLAIKINETREGEVLFTKEDKQRAWGMIK